jgi:hypothetical protein
MPKVLQSQKDRIMELHSNQIKKALQSHDWSLSHNRTNDYAQYEPSNEGKRRRRVGRKRKKTLEAIKTNDEEINLKADGRDWGPPKREVYPMSPDYVFKEEPYRFFSNKIEKNDPILSVLERDEEDES